MPPGAMLANKTRSMNHAGRVAKSGMRRSPIRRVARHFQHPPGRRPALRVHGQAASARPVWLKPHLYATRESRILDPVSRRWNAPDTQKTAALELKSDPLSEVATRPPGCAEYQVAPAAFHQARGWLWRALGRAYLRLGGWRIEGVFPAEPKYVVIVAPHTSNWDFPLGLAVLFAHELRISWLAKHSMFLPPFRTLLRWLGGIPINRSASHGVVSECVRAFSTRPSLMLALAPEGTRRSGGRWKTGFYLIATKAGVPILPVGFDYGNRVVRLMPLFQPTGILENDLPLLQARFKDVQGRRRRPARPGSV